VIIPCRKYSVCPPKKKEHSSISTKKCCLTCLQRSRSVAKVISEIPESDDGSENNYTPNSQGKVGATAVKPGRPKKPYTQLGLKRKKQIQEESRKKIRKLVNSNDDVPHLFVDLVGTDFERLRMLENIQELMKLSKDGPVNFKTMESVLTKKLSAQTAAQITSTPQINSAAQKKMLEDLKVV